jgi:hypothetical protein
MHAHAHAPADGHLVLRRAQPRVRATRQRSLRHEENKQGR